jgi:hypothetical protein
MNDSQLKFLRTVLFLNKCILLFVLFVNQFILLLLGEIFFAFGSVSIFLEGSTIGGSKISSFLFLEPSRLLEKAMSKIALIAKDISGTKI